MCLETTSHVQLPNTYVAFSSHLDLFVVELGKHMQNVRILQMFSFLTECPLTFIKEAYVKPPNVSAVTSAHKRIPN